MHKHKYRSDAGHLLATPRDHFVLSWVAEQHTATFKQVQRLLVLYREEAVPNNLLLSDTATRNALTRWQTLGFIEKPQRLWYQYPSFIWLARGGLTDLGIPYRHYVPNRKAVLHFAAVNEVRLSIAGAHRPDVWISRRALIASHELEHKGHMANTDTPMERTFFPDGVLALDNQPEHIAISIIERQRQSQDLLLLTQGLLKQYRAICYYTCPAMVSVLEEIRAALPLCKRFDIYDLTTMQPLVSTIDVASFSSTGVMLSPASSCEPGDSAVIPGTVSAAHSANPARQGKGKIKARQKTRCPSEQGN